MVEEIEEKSLGNQQGRIENNMEKPQASCLVGVKKLLLKNLEKIQKQLRWQKNISKEKKCVSCVESVAR